MIKLYFLATNTFFVFRYNLFNYFTSIEDSHTKYIHYQMTKPLSIQVRILKYLSSVLSFKLLLWFQKFYVSIAPKLNFGSILEYHYQSSICFTYCLQNKIYNLIH